MSVSFRDCGEFTRGEDGAWYGVTRPLDAGFHSYTIEIDGAEVPDPNSMMYFGAMLWGSAVELPAPDQDFYATRNVPHGQLREIYFHSPSTETERRAFVYTPPGYDQSPDQHDPVLYLQHGWGENEYGMTNHIRFGGMSEFWIEPFETVLVPWWRAPGLRAVTW